MSDDSENSEDNELKFICDLCDEKFEPNADSVVGAQIVKDNPDMESYEKGDEWKFDGQTPDDPQFEESTLIICDKCKGELDDGCDT